MGEEQDCPAENGFRAGRHYVTAPVSLATGFWIWTEAAFDAGFRVGGILSVICKYASPFYGHPGNSPSPFNGGIMKFKLLLVFVCLGNVVVTSSPAAGGENAAPPPKHFQILETQQINLGDRSIYYHRVVPPNLPEPPPPRPPVPLSPAEEAALLQAQSKEQRVIFLSATVYDRRISDLRWHSEGMEYRAFTNIDFNYFTHTSDFATDRAFYFFFMGIGNEPIEQWNHLLADRSLSNPVKSSLQALLHRPPAQPGFVLVDWNDASAPHQKARADLETLHGFYQNNWQRMQEQFRAAQTEQAAHEAWLREHPRQPKDSVIHFWPKKNSRYLNEGGAK